MALLPLDSARTEVVRCLKKMHSPQGVALLTYKRDRGVVILRIADDTYEVREYGFTRERAQVTGHRLGRLLKTIIRREFPRSRRARFLKLAGRDDLARISREL